MSSPKDLTFAARVQYSEWDYFSGLDIQIQPTAPSSGLDSPEEETQVGKDGESGKCCSAGSSGPSQEMIYSGWKCSGGPRGSPAVI